jgi:hypothetical protein
MRVMSREANIIAAQEAKVADLRKKADEAARAAETEEAVLRGMKLIMNQAAGMGSLLSPPGPPALVKQYQTGVDRAAKRGRQPGAISHEWRNALGILHKGFPGGFNIQEVVSVAHNVGLPNVKERDAEERMRSYLQLGYVERIDRGYSVSELVARKYGFSRHQTVEAPTAVAEGAS